MQLRRSTFIAQVGPMRVGQWMGGVLEGWGSGGVGLWMGGALEGWGSRRIGPWRVGL